MVLNSIDMDIFRLSFVEHSPVLSKGMLNRPCSPQSTSSKGNMHMYTPKTGHQHKLSQEFVLLGSHLDISQLGLIVIIN